MKKLIALLLSFILVATTAAAAPSFGGNSDSSDSSTSASTAKDGMSTAIASPDFEDTFEFDSGVWDLGYDFSIKDGTLYASKDKFAQCSTFYNQWENFTMEFDFTIKEMTTFEDKGFWFGPNLRGTNYMFQRTFIQYNSPETGVQNGVTISTPLEDNVTYSVKIEASEKKAVLYLKKQSENKYTKLGIMPIAQSVGKIGFVSYPAGIAYDNVRVWDTTERPFKFAQMSTRIDVGGSAKLEVVNNSGDALTFESADTSIATVSADGTVTAVSAGTVQITAKNDSGYSASTTVISNVSVTALNLCTYERELYVNDSMILYNKSWHSTLKDFVI